MLAAINLDDQLLIERHEIDNEPGNRHLTLELDTGEAACAKPVPQKRLGVGLSFTQRTSVSSQTRSPLTLPSPQPKSDLSDFGRSIVPNSGKPEFGWGEGKKS